MKYAPIAAICPQVMRGALRPWIGCARRSSRKFRWPSGLVEKLATLPWTGKNGDREGTGEAIARPSRGDRIPLFEW